MLDKNIREALTFDDVLLVPRQSSVVPKDTDITTRLTGKISLNIPLVSAPMDTVTESEMAIALAQEGGIGIIHKNLSIKKQVKEVDKVKRWVSGMIVDPITMSPDQMVDEALKLMAKYSISGIPITDGEKLAGILTHRDLRFMTDTNVPISTVMTSENLVTVPEGTTLEQSKEYLHKNRIEKLLVVDDVGNLKGLITIKDIEKSRKYPNAAKDAKGRLLVGCAVGVSPESKDRVAALVEIGADVIVVDTAHGHSEMVYKMVEYLRSRYPDIQIIGGNVATAEATEYLIKAGANAVKVGIGPGSICTTRIVAGVGVPQLTAISDCAKVGDKYDVPIIADGGIRFSGDITKAIAAGASTVMIGGLFAGTDESPAEKIFFQGRAYKGYRGMGSIGAMAEGSSDRYFQDNEMYSMKFVPEGVEGRIPYKGALSFNTHQLIGGLRSGMGYCGCKTIVDLQKNGQFVKISSAGSKESHVHDIVITKEAPNYQVE
ncbi:MAG: IMP dehydrogenase [Nitrospinae bacterium]|nr:IMP dehydrogenase [Nitrospinota bacterium]